MSDVEKTFIDLVAFRELRKELLPAFRKAVDRVKLTAYLQRYDTRFRARVLALLHYRQRQRRTASPRGDAAGCCAAATTVPESTTGAEYINLA
ncbi:MAG: hypothetical protein HY520_03270, partial [Candidatus Aenigmarchaeota archaeon]|nr:hypothetical protein [Candidatus Aenigmarchaeota archaeon]